MSAPVILCMKQVGMFEAARRSRRIRATSTWHFIDPVTWKVIGSESGPGRPRHAPPGCIITREYQ